MKKEEETPITPSQKIWIGSSLENTLSFAANHLLSICKDSIKKKGLCSIALCGGSTPKAIFERLSNHPEQNSIDWGKVFLYFSDERSVQPTSKDSNFHMAMHSGLQNINIPKDQIFRMKAETDIERHARDYESLIANHIPDYSFDLVMLGVGEDGHTASLFPETEALKEKKRWVVANYVPKKKTWRMTFTFPLINRAKNIAVYSLGERKQEIIEHIFIHHKNQLLYPSQKVGTVENKALWILDNQAATPLLKE